jgi:Family of unknown function (DUF6092)
VKETVPENRLYELVAYLVSCSRLTLDEPQIYGSFRLIEAVVRLVEAAEALGVTVDPEIYVVRDSIDREKMRMIEDHDGYRTWLDLLLAEVAAEATRRNLESPAPS